MSYYLMTDDELAKDLGLLSALTIGIGTMIGAGIFILPGVASREAGPLVIASFLIGGTIAMLNAFAVAELGTAMPKAGGAYYWINRALGPLFGTVSGMGDWMGLAFASAFYCIGFGGYLSALLEGAVVSIPSIGTLSLALPTVDLFLFTLTDVQVGALIAAAIFVGVNYIGAKETGGVQTVIVNEDEVSNEFEEAGIVVVLYLLALLAGLAVVLTALPGDVPLEYGIFEVMSAQSNVGLSAGITGPGMPTVTKISLMLNMWVGRLEIIPVLVLLRVALIGTEYP